MYRVCNEIWHPPRANISSRQSPLAACPIDPTFCQLFESVGWQNRIQMLRKRSNQNTKSKTSKNLLYQIKPARQLNRTSWSSICISKLQKATKKHFLAKIHILKNLIADISSFFISLKLLGIKVVQYPVYKGPIRSTNSRFS